MRETVSDNSLGSVSSPEITLAREVRVDQYGIELAINKLGGDKVYRKKCIDGLSVTNSAVISKGLKTLSKLIES